MKKFRQFIVGLIAPCRCRVTYSRGNCMEWMNCDASECQRWGHNDECRPIGLAP